MSSRRALLMRRGSKVRLTRMSSTTYLVEAVGGGTKANLRFKRLSDGYVQNVGNVALPYTFTHTAGEVWEVSRNRGATYVSAWAVDIPLGAYLEAQNFTDLELSNHMKISFYWDGQAIDNVAIVFGKVTISDDNYRWMVNISENKMGFWTKNTGEITLLRNESISAGWNVFEVSINGNQVTQTLNGVSNTYTIDANEIAYVADNKKFRIGREYSGFIRRFVGKVQYYEHGDEIFKMQEGVGNVVGSKGTTLLENGTSWEKI